MWVDVREDDNGNVIGIDPASAEHISTRSVFELKS